MYLRLLKDYHSEIVEVTDMNDWLGIRQLWLRVVVCYLKDYHGNGIEVTDMDD